MIHPSAIIDDSAELAADVEVGAWSKIGPEVTVGEGTVIGSNVVIDGPTRIGSGNKIYSFNAIGGDSQDKKFRGEHAVLEIGDNNVIREFCTLNRGTADGGGITKIGDKNWIMAYVHVAHDCQLGNHIVMANSASLAGHVVVGDYVTFGGFTLVHQFCAIGSYCFTGLGSVITKDVPHYVTVSGSPAKPHGLNSEGLKRNGFDAESLRWIKRAYKVIYKHGLSLEQAQAELQELTSECASIGPLLQFTKDSTRGIVR